MKILSYRSYAAEGLGTAGIVCVVLGSGFMVTSMSSPPGVGLGLIALAVAAYLAIAIYVLGPISGAHLNPVVTLAFLLNRNITPKDAVFYVLFQIIGALLGAMAANLMFERDLIFLNTTIRAGYGQLAGEFLATAGLVFIILALIAQNQSFLVAPAVGLWIAAGHIFTSSTSFANPAVTIGRALSESWSGISLQSVPGFLVVQILGALAGLLLFKFFFSQNSPSSKKKEI